MPVIKEWLAEGRSVRFAPRGISMRPMLRQGLDTVLLSPLPDKLKKFDLPLYQRSNGQYVLHRIVAVGDTYTCIGDNQLTREHNVTHDQMIGLVTSFYRANRKIPVDDIWYKCYCRIWHYSRPIRRIWRCGISLLRRLFR